MKKRIDEEKFKEGQPILEYIGAKKRLGKIVIGNSEWLKTFR